MPYIIRVFCPQDPRPQFCRRQVFHRKLRNQGCSFTRDWIGSVASRCFPHPTLSLASEQTIKDLKRYQRHQRAGEESGFGYSFAYLALSFNRCKTVISVATPPELVRIGNYIISMLNEFQTISHCRSWH